MVKKSRRAKRTEKEILMAAKRLPTFGAAALDADIAATEPRITARSGGSPASLSPLHRGTTQDLSRLRRQVLAGLHFP